MTNGPADVWGGRMKRRTGIQCWVVTAQAIGLAMVMVGRSEGSGETAELGTSAVQARFGMGSVAELRTADGKRLCGDAALDGVGIHAVKGDIFVSAGKWEGPAGGGGSASNDGSRTCRGSWEGAKGGFAELNVRADDSTGDLVLRQHCESQDAGVWGVSWAIGGIPLDSAIIVPGQSGIRLTREAPGQEFVFDYPLGWEAGLVIVEGVGGGFSVWADDPKGRFKRLVVKRSESAWSLRMITVNQAPFDDLTGCESVDWRLTTYEGDWRVPARRYREWMETAFRPVPVGEQRPAWVRDIRAMVITGLSLEVLEELPKRFDPAQTILYVPDWREAGYDRDYPVYDQVRPALDPFLDRAHALGFRVMLHVNYFGVDPLNPLYERFEPYQVRDPWGGHDKKWWLWTRATPEIRFAYINPALKAWRELFVAAMGKLCREHRVDALHLDQTLCIFNDHNGLIDGLSMVEGNVLLHRELREALPDVALSGEGLNEVTFRHEAFAQRHARGVHHAEGTWDRRWLALAHPVSSYLFRPYVVINGYLGCAPPENGQLYAAWNEAYEHWGVIPTLKPSLHSLRQPEGFARQFFDETAFWLGAQLDPAMEEDWPAEVAFPFRAADGKRAARMADGRFVSGERLISRTITGVHRAPADGGIVPGWRGYDGKQVLGLDPSRWYPWFPGEPSADDFHVCEAPEKVVVDSAILHEDMAFLRLGAVVESVADLADRLEGATVRSRPFDPAQPQAESRGSWTAPDGGGFSRAGGSMLAAHPPYKVKGGGEALVLFAVDLPSGGVLRFRSGIKLGEGAMSEGRSDGVTFGCTAQAGGLERRVQVHHASELPAELELDLTLFAGKRVEIELSVGPGPAGEASFDWARWEDPRIEQLPAREAEVGVAGGGRWDLALGPGGPRGVQVRGDVARFSMPVPGACILLREKPAAVSGRLDLTAAQHRSLALRSGEVLGQQPDYIRVGVGSARCGGVERRGFSAHPPDQGETMILFPVTLGPDRAKLRAWAGLRDGSKSEGVIFRIEVNGQEVARRAMMPGGWHEIEADLSAWRGQPVVLGLVTDSDGSHYYDWAWWGEPFVGIR